jgi:alkanesulfonate monooxygenase SsuD/methylene tetrahydromethanopterin reductase-like flavin-dependent oxidoreductase (luciferase family)
MKVGLHVPVFAWQGGAEALADHLINVAEHAEAAGFDQITVMDHYFALGPGDAYRRPMLEAYTALGFIAARTTRVRLGALVTGVMYRYPGILIKQVTTLNVLSKGRGFLGIGAAWHEREHRAFGVPFPPLKERFERLEETLRIAHQAWSGDTRPFQAQYYSLEEPLLSPEAVSKPRPRILIGGSTAPRSAATKLRSKRRAGSAWRSPRTARTFRRSSTASRQLARPASTW